MRKKLSKKALKRIQNKTAKDAKAAASAGEEVSKLTDLGGWLTRNEVCDMLKVSPQTIQNYESRKLLNPLHGLRKDRTGLERVMLVYNPTELAALPSRTGAGLPRIDARAPGEQAAQAFQAFREGKPLDLIVIELRETPDRIDYLHERWLDQTKARHVITPTVKQALEEMLGEFKSVTELVELQAKLLETHGRLVITAEAKKIFEQLLGPFTNVMELIGLVTKKLAA